MTLAGAGARATQLRPDRIRDRARSQHVRLAVTASSGALALALGVLAAHHFAETSWPIFRVHPGLLAAACAFSLLGYAFKAQGWRRLFSAVERPHALTLAAANGGASVTALVLPGRFDDVVRIAIARRLRGCPAGVRALCLSICMLGLIDSAALAPLAFAAAALPGHTTAVRLGLVLLGVVGLGAAAIVFALPRVAASSRLLRFRLGRWLSPRTTPFRDAAVAWTFVSAAWLTRVGGLLVLLMALGVGFSFTLALLFLCATSAAAALPVGPGSAATQAAAGTAVLIAAGTGASEALGVAVAVHAVGVLVGAAIFAVAASWRVALRFAGSENAPSTVSSPATSPATSPA